MFMDQAESKKQHSILPETKISLAAWTIVKLVTFDYIHVKTLSLNSGNFISAENKKLQFSLQYFAFFYNLCLKLEITPRPRPLIW